MKKENVTVLSVIVNVLLSLAKVLMGVFSRSTAILADGIHSGMDVVTSVISLIGIRASGKPEDKEHPYGHHKSETVAGLIITMILFISGAYIVIESVQDFLGVKTLEVSLTMLAVMAVSAAINTAMSELKLRTGKKNDSMALIADGRHSRMDVYTSVGVFAGLLASAYWPYADSLLAALIGIYIIKSSISLGRETTDSLLDVSAGDETEGKITKAVKGQKIQLWGLKTKKIGSSISAELRIGLDPKVRVEEASEISAGLEKKLKGSIENLKYVVIQIESHRIKESYYGRGTGRMQWKGRMGGHGRGPSGDCVCPKCGHRQPHSRGSPCYRMKCPECGAKMTRT